jgi:hypothetical protein
MLLIAVLEEKAAKLNSQKQLWLPKLQTVLENYFVLYG